MKFKDRARKAGRVYGLNPDAAVETLTHMHELIRDLIDMGVPIKLEGFFETKHQAKSFKDNVKIGDNKKKVRKAIASGRNLYIYPEQKLIV